MLSIRLFSQSNYSNLIDDNFNLKPGSVAAAILHVLLFSLSVTSSSLLLALTLAGGAPSSSASSSFEVVVDAFRIDAYAYLILAMLALTDSSWQTMGLG